MGDTKTFPYVPLMVVHCDKTVYDLPWTFIGNDSMTPTWVPVSGMKRGTLNQIYAATGGKAHTWKKHKIGFSNYGYLRGALEEKIKPGTVCFSVDGLDNRFVDNHKGKIVLDGGEPVGIIDYQTGEFNFKTDSKVVDRIISVAYAKEIS